MMTLPISANTCCENDGTACIRVILGEAVTTTRASRNSRLVTESGGARSWGRVCAEREPSRTHAADRRAPRHACESADARLARDHRGDAQFPGQPIAEPGVRDVDCHRRGASGLIQRAERPHEFKRRQATL